MFTNKSFEGPRVVSLSTHHLTRQQLRQRGVRSARKVQA